MFGTTILLLIVSVLAQILVAGLAAMQMRRLGGYRLAWAAISLAAILMIWRRVGSLELAMSTGLFDAASAFLGAAISLLLVLGMFGLRRLFLELEKQRQQLEILSITDSLTGLSNRRHAFERGAQEVLRAGRSGEPLAVIMLDLDRFKAVNDLHGHAAGDAVLVAVADVLRAGLRQVDVVGRIGGEEFLLLLPNTDSSGAGAIAERLRQRTEQMGVVLQDGSRVRITASFGLVITGGVNHGAEETLRQTLSQADAALYVAKQRGRNRVEYWTPDMSVQAS